jgi:hypothetical protein
MWWLLACSEKNWVEDVPEWYCGTESVAGTEARDARSRDMAVRWRREVDGGLAGRYALQNRGETYIGTLSAFAPGEPRTATMSWENDHSQRGAARMTFSADYQTLTIRWQVGAESDSGGSTLKASSADACPTAALLR